MPGWYIHTEAAKVTVQRLLNGDVPANLGFDPDAAQQYAETGYKWRNYLAIGALAPDLFYLLPDFKAPLGNTLLSVVQWLLDVWKTFDELFFGSWEKWMGPACSNGVVAQT